MKDKQDEIRNILLRYVSYAGVIDPKHTDEALGSLDQYITDRIIEARIDELEKWQHHWFKLATTVPRMQASPPQLKVYVAGRIAELQAQLKVHKTTPSVDINTSKVNKLRGKSND